jgi:hypothetical protein
VALVRTDVSEELDLAFLRSVRRLPVTASAVPSSPILVTLIKGALSSSEASVLTRATRRNIQEDAILQTSFGLSLNVNMEAGHTGEDRAVCKHSARARGNCFWDL